MQTEFFLEKLLNIYVDPKCEKNKRTGSSIQDTRVCKNNFSNKIPIILPFKSISTLPQFDT